MKCNSCRRYGSYGEDYGGACKDCYETLEAKVDFLRLCSPSSAASDSFPVIVLFASDGGSAPVLAHKAVLVSRSPVLRAMLENEMTESLSGTIKIADVSYDTLAAFVNFLYTAEAETNLDRQLVCDLLMLAEKYQVQHLKDYCQNLLVSDLNWDNALMTYSFAHQHNADRLIDAALELIVDNMDRLTAREEYVQLKKKDPQLVIQIYEAHHSKQLTTALAAKWKE